MPDVQKAQALYDLVRKWFALMPTAICPLTFVIDAPFGRFSPSQDSIFLVDGIKSWIFMELIAPTTFLYTFLQSPLSPTAAGSAPPLTLTHPPTFLAALFLLHYLNRAIISPLRTPSRSKSHIMVPLSAVGFNVINGALLGAYLSSPTAQAFLAGGFERPQFWAGVVLWAVGLVGNIAHDEILLNIRRNAKAKGKARQITGAAKGDDDDDNGKSKKNKQEHYAIPHGLLYRFISYPNYFCEWMEWLGFAIAASPPPLITSLAAFLTTISPPWLFFFSEVLLMFPRAWKGHKWYHRRFPDYPKERKAVIPFIL
ncbi:3-oxo-5-alpha-steroid 4-dehydrogenase-domain-containing protein [Trametes punicea]|nr:3-oxo-5-alpha-steroid 4-dehydrogenase-domain-containing protein [Trametes punicea]